ncbi:MAG: hypothetical protein QOF02_3133 [Blastocatellia bacterium]|jgi:hypothetical protein|nr:hypothetical protein [Blastocatellia bacterium]
MKLRVSACLFLLAFICATAFAPAQSSTRQESKVRQEFEQVLKGSGARSSISLMTSGTESLHLARQPGKREEPLKIPTCQLKSDPAAYNHKLIEVTGFISHGFEDFTLSDPQCPSWPGVWLEYGGKAASGTMYCCGVAADRSRPKPLRVETINIPLVDDERFRAFDKLLQGRPDSVVHATIVGRFFAGQQMKYPNGVAWGGYGHMGCCSLLAIQQVVSVDPHDREDLDYGASADQPKLDKEGCGYKFLTPLESSGYLIEAQRKADAGERAWAFSNPQRVATEALARLLNIEEKSINELKETRKAQGRVVYQWKLKEKEASYMIVVGRPYLLSFYAKDPKLVAWVIMAAYESSCGEGNSVTRVR